MKSRRRTMISTDLNIHQFSCLCFSYQRRMALSDHHQLSLINTSQLAKHMIFTLYTYMYVQLHQAKPEDLPSRNKIPHRKIPRAPFTSLSTTYLQSLHRKPF